MKLYTYKFYMKSGNVIVADRCEEFTFYYNGNVVTKITDWKQHQPKNLLLLSAIDLSQIESIIRATTFSERVFGRISNLFKRK